MNTLSKKLCDIIGNLAILVLAVLLLFPWAANAAPKGELVIADNTLTQLYDPIKQTGFHPVLGFAFMFDGLVNLEAEGKVPGLATSWEISEDGLTIDFKLRRGVKWHNGDPFTAEDVKFTYESIIAEGSTHLYRSYFVPALKSVEVVNPHLARFHLKEPWPSFFSSARQGLQMIVPKTYYQKVGPEEFQKNPIGTGPFKLHSLKSGEWTKWEANTDYWGQVPDVQFVVQRLANEPITRFAMLVRGETDIITNIIGPVMDAVKKDPKLRVVVTRYSGISFFHFNRRAQPEFKDPRVRKAVAYAIDYDGIADVIQQGMCERARSVFTPATFGYNPSVDTGISYNPDKARKLLAEAGFADGLKTGYILHTQSFSSLPNAPQVLEAIAGNLEAVGFKLERITVDTAGWSRHQRSETMPGIFYGPTGVPDDGGALMNSWFLSTSRVSARAVQNPDYDRIYYSQQKEANLEKRKKVLQDFAKMEAENLESIPLFWCHTPFAVGPRVKSWEPAVGSGMHWRLHNAKLGK